jgi:hypothetical protein
MNQTDRGVPDPYDRMGVQRWLASDGGAGDGDHLHTGRHLLLERVCIQLSCFSE